jgi:putative transposase
VAQGISDDELAMIRTYAQRQRALGTNRFQQAIELQLGRRAGKGAPGRPRKARDIGVGRE